MIGIKPKDIIKNKPSPKGQISHAFTIQPSKVQSSKGQEIDKDF